MKAIKKCDENLVKVAKRISFIYTIHEFYSRSGFEPSNHGIILLSHSTCISCVIFREIPSNYSYSVSVDDGCLTLCIWYD